MNNKPNTNEYHIGDIYMMEFEGSGSEQRGLRPGLIFQNNLGNKYSSNVIALPLTTSMKKLNQPTHVVIPSKGTGLKRDSMVLCENPTPISKDRIRFYITTLSEEYMSKVAVANMLASSAIAFVDLDTLLDTWKRANALNATV